MRCTPNVKAERYRLREGDLATDSHFGNNGAFLVPVGRRVLQVIISDEDGWDHVSVSLPERCPTWDEMCAVKELFFKDDETVVQFHPARPRYVNCHPFCLHLWRKQDGVHELPPSWMVGSLDGEGEKDATSSSPPCPTTS